LPPFERHVELAESRHPVMMDAEPVLDANQVAVELKRATVVVAERALRPTWVNLGHRWRCHRPAVTLPRYRGTAGALPPTTAPVPAVCPPAAALTCALRCPPLALAELGIGGGEVAEPELDAEHRGR